MEAVLEATVRETIGKNEARRTRRQGQVPAVVYGAASEGASRDAQSIAVEPRALLKILHSEAGANTLISLRLGGNDTKVLVKDFQLDPITHEVLHADFFRVAMDRMIEVTIPVLVKGEARGVKQQGGLLEFVRREIEIECLPADIPEHVDVDVTDLMVGQGIRLRDVATDPRWKPLTDLDTMLVHIILPKAEESAAAAAEGGATGSEPEIIKKGKKEEAEAEKK
ncbi:MAG: 50S ribosomal protein L25 [Vicinamibacterales bacterium]